MVWLIDGIFNLVAKIASIVTRKKIDLSDHCMRVWVYWRLRKDVVDEIQENNIEDIVYRKEGSEIWESLKVGNLQGMSLRGFIATWRDRS